MIAAIIACVLVWIAAGAMILHAIRTAQPDPYGDTDSEVG